MKFVTVDRENEIAMVTLSRGKVNALNEPMVEEISHCFTDLERDPTARAVILTGTGKFFSFGFDIPGFMDDPPESFRRYIEKFSRLYLSIFTFPKPVVAALNGHTIAGGCMLASACDHRVMVTGKAKISLNEIGFGSSVFAGIVAILKYWVGARNAQEILYSGKMYSAEEAIKLGLVDETTSEEDLLAHSRRIAQDLAARAGAAFAAIKGLLRKPLVEEISRLEEASIEEFITIWYSESTRKNLESIKISS